MFKPKIPYQICQNLNKSSILTPKPPQPAENPHKKSKNQKSTHIFHFTPCPTPVQSPPAMSSKEKMPPHPKLRDFKLPPDPLVTAPPGKYPTPMEQPTPAGSIEVTNPRAPMNMFKEEGTGRIVSPYEDRKEEIITRICELLSQGKTFKRAVSEPNMPHFLTIANWRREDDDIAARITQAQLVGFDHIGDECLEIADKPAIDLTDVQNRRLQIETRLKLLAKWHPRKYGERLEIDGNITVNISPLEQLRRLERKARGDKPVIDVGTGRELLPDDVGGGRVLPAEITDAWRKRRDAAREAEERQHQHQHHQPGLPGVEIGEDDCF